ncbi:hypothetical protein J7643_17435 [bacterium]|nr:hypothetical protein [bacterium]
MAVSLSSINQQPRRVAAGGGAQPANWLAGSQGEALLNSSNMLRDTFVRSSSAVSNLDSAVSNAATRPVSLADASRDLGNTLKTVDKLGKEMNVVLGRSNQAATGKAFVGITTVTDTAGAFADLSRSQAAAARDLAELQRVLADPNATSALKLAATARATQSASTYVRHQQGAINAIKAADAHYLSNPTYQRMTAEMRDSGMMRFLGKVDEVLSPGVLKAAQVAGTSAGLVLGVVAVPTMVKSVGTTYDRLRDTLADDNATRDQKIDAIADLSRATAGTIQGVEGVRLSLTSLGELAANSRLFGGVMGRLQGVGALAKAGSWFTRFMRVLSPVADVGMLIADGVKLKHVFSDANATGWDKARAILNVGLDGLKLATWLIPGTAALRTAYIGASFLQLGLAAYDFGHSMGPTLKKVGSAAVNTVLHPVQTARAAGNALGEGMLYVSNKVYGAAELLERAVLHPVETAKDVGEAASGAIAKVREVGGVFRDSAAVVKAQP